jgi:hypothetical protein
MASRRKRIDSLSWTGRELAISPGSVHSPGAGSGDGAASENTNE